LARLLAGHKPNREFVGNTEGKSGEKSKFAVNEKKKLSTIDFQTIIRQEWEGLDDNLFLRLANSMKNRVSEVIEREGKKTDY